MVARDQKEKLIQSWFDVILIVMPVVILGINVLISPQTRRLAKNQETVETTLMAQSDDSSWDDDDLDWD